MPLLHGRAADARSAVSVGSGARSRSAWCSAARSRSDCAAIRPPNAITASPGAGAGAGAQSNAPSVALQPLSLAGSLALAPLRCAAARTASHDQGLRDEAR